MNCICGEKVEVRQTEDGFVFGCWHENHRELLEITDETGITPIATEYDLFPLTGCTAETEEKAIKSWEYWHNEVFRLIVA